VQDCIRLHLVAIKDVTATMYLPECKTVDQFKLIINFFRNLRSVLY